MGDFNHKKYIYIYTYGIGMYNNYPQVKCKEKSLKKKEGFCSGDSRLAPEADGIRRQP